MGAAVEITRMEHTAEALRDLAGKSRDGAQVRRLLSLALILEGYPRQAAGRGGSAVHGHAQRENDRKLAAQVGPDPVAATTLSSEER